MLSFRVLNLQETACLIDPDFLSHPFINSYIKSRPGILIDIDIFCYNKLRVQNQTQTAFHLFKQVDGQADFLVCPIYLELLEYTHDDSDWRIKMQSFIERLSSTYPHDRLVYQWNHDIDFAEFGWMSDIPRAYVIQFNTSRPNHNDIVVPFWNINTKPHSEPKKVFAGFYGNFNNPIRANLAKEISGKPGYKVINTGAHRQYSEEEFLNLISSTCWAFCPRGVGLSSYRFFEAFHAGTVPVLMADKTALPYQNQIDYNRICIRLPENSSFDRIDRTLRSFDDRIFISEIQKVREMFTLKGVQEHIYQRLSK